jgi:cytochrome P450
MISSPKKVTLPGPKGAERLAVLRKLQKNPLSALLKTADRYGDFAVLALGPQKIYLVNHPTYIQHILQTNNRNYSKDTFQYNLLSSVTGNGLLTSDGDLWFRQRRMMQPAFHRQHIAGFAQVITAATLKMLARWALLERDGKPVDVDAEMMRLTLEIIGKTLFSVDLSADAETLAGAVLTVLDHIVHRARHPISLPPVFPTPRNRAFEQALRTLNQAVLDIIKEHRERHQSDQMATNVLSMLLQVRDEETGERMDDRQVRDEVITLIIAGHETVASALTWTWYLLAQNPEVETRFHQELVHALDGQTPKAEHLQALPVTRMIFQEALRLYPPAWMISRKAIDDDILSIDGQAVQYPVESGGLVIISPYITHRHPQFWDRVEEFDPRRFADERSATRRRFAYLPFGGGPRLCIGDRFAMLESQLILATIGQRYRLELVDDPPVEPEPLVTLRPHGGLLMTLQRS